MHIGFVVYGSIEQQSGGYRYDRKLIEYLRNQGDTVEILSISQGSSLENVVTGFSPSLRRKLDQPFDILIQDELCHPSLWRVNERLQEPNSIISLVHLLRAGPPRKKFHSLSRRIERAYLGSVDAIICTSRDTQRRVESLVDIPSTVVYPAGREEGAAVTPQQVRNRAQENPLRILFVGTVSPRKETSTVIDALNDVEQPWHCDIIGSLDAFPEYVANIRSRIDQYGLQDSVTLHGEISDTALSRFFERSHLLAVPSQYESFGMSYLEGMEYGVVPVATKVGGAKEFVEHNESGWLVSPGNAGELRTAFATLQRERAMVESLAVGAVTQAQNHPSWERSFSQLREVLVSVANDGPIELPNERSPENQLTHNS